MVKMEKVISGRISEIGYDSNESELYIRFKTNNALYKYYDVPMEVFVGLKAALSPGTYFGKEIKGIYSYEKVV